MDEFVGATFSAINYCTTMKEHTFYKQTLGM